jgi:predicted  nucleic acid-binding Zn-ribbon protein
MGVDPEALIKALDKRMAGVERTLDSLAKEVRGVAASLDGLDKRLVALERGVEGVKSMVKNHDSIIKSLSAGGDDKALIATQVELKRLEKRAAEHEAKLRAAQNTNLPPSATQEQHKQHDVELAKLKKQKEQLGDTINTVLTAQTKAERSINAVLDKYKVEIDAMIKRDVAEARFKVLETQVQMALTLAQRR